MADSASVKVFSILIKRSLEVCPEAKGLVEEILDDIQREPAQAVNAFAQQLILAGVTTKDWREFVNEVYAEMDDPSF